ncbi:MAG: L-type lectin-domain containing protein [Polyangiaceae bacterium]
MHHLALRLWLFLSTFALLTLALAQSAWARVDVCYAGGQFLPNFTLNGNATLNGTDILVTSATGNLRGSVMYDTPLSTAGDIHIRFVVKISLSGNGGADGMAFVMHNASTGVSTVGAAGGGVGYDGISPAVVVEFDTYKNGWDPDDNHVAITRGVADHTATINSGLPVVTSPPVTLKSGSNINVWIDYVASTHTLNVFLSASTTKPALATLSTTTVNVATILGSQMYIGFTGSTGGSWNQHEIVELYASDSANPGEACCATNADCTGKTAPLGTVCDPVKKVCGPCSLVDDGSCTQPAGCNVSAALNVCTTVCAGDYGSGGTNACLSSTFKSCSTTGLTSGNCIMCNGDYTAGSGLTVRCPSGAPTCLDDGFCGSCKVNADCTTGFGHAGGLCNVTTGQCYCGSNSDCTGASAGPTCTGGICGCTTDAQCGTGNFCSNSVCKPKLGNGVLIPNDTLHAATCNTTVATAVCQSAQCNATTKTCSGPNTTTDCTLASQCTSNVCGSNLKCGTIDFSGPCASGSVCQSGLCSNGGNVCLATNSCWMDADCASTQFCNRTTRSCTTDFAIGTALPNDGYHLGTCADAAAVCASHACNAVKSTCAAPNGTTCSTTSQCVVDICGSNGSCGIADYDGTCSTSDAATLCQSGACSAGFVCMASTACYVDQDCLATQFCNRSAHTCTTRLIAGGDIPNDGLHDGGCLASSAVCAVGLGCNGVATTCAASNGVTCSNADQCIANVCGTNSKCGYADGTGVCNSSNAVSLCQSGTCSANAGICIPAVNGCAADDDCGIGSYCDGLSFTCKPRLGAGASLPTDGIHDGTCSAATRVCETGLTCNANALTCGRPLSGACSTREQCAIDICGGNGLCGLANLQSSCTTSNATTICQSGNCGSSSGVCVAGPKGCGSDADCSSTEYCDGSTHQCVSRLDNGTPLPNDGLHDGTCAISATSAVCASGQCNSATDTCAGANGTDCNSAADCVVDRCGSNKKCGLADGQAGCTASDGEKICQSAECALSGTCVPTDGCYIDTDCSSNQYCDRSSLLCHAKLTKGETIPTDGLHLGSCDDAANVCVSGHCNAVQSTCAETNGIDCGSNAQCTVNICGANGKCGIANGGPGCTPATGATLCQSSTCPASGVCIPSNTFCWLDSDCAAEQFCHRATNQCVSDLLAGVALPNDGLHDGQCTAGLAQAVCATGLCNGKTSTCASANNVSCTSRAECQSDICGSNQLCGQNQRTGPLQRSHLRPLSERNLRRKQ